MLSYFFLSFWYRDSTFKFCPSLVVPVGLLVLYTIKLTLFIAAVPFISLLLLHCVLATSSSQGVQV